MSKNNYKFFLASIISFALFFSFFQSSQAGFFDWFKWLRKNDSQNTTRVVPSAEQNTYYSLSISKSGSGIVISDDGKINCGNQCEASYPANSKIVLKAEAGDNYKFDRWNGCDKVSDGQCQTTLNKSKMIVAKFASKKASFSSSQKSSSASKSSSVSSKTNSSKASSSISSNENSSSVSKFSSSSFSFSSSGSSGINSLDSKSTQKGIILVLLEEKLEDYLKKELENYSEDVFKEIGQKIIIRNVSSPETTKDLKKIVKSFYQENKLEGVFLVGNIPTGQFYYGQKTNEVFSQEGLVLSDSIYQDILDACIYSDEQKAFAIDDSDCSSATKNYPFWVARVSANPSAGDSIPLLKDYFNRNHNYRNGLYSYNKKTLIYSPIILDESVTERPEAIEKVKKSFEFWNIDKSLDYYFIDINEKESDTIYSQEIQKTNNHELIVFNGHGNPTFHQRNFTSQNLPKTSFFYLDMRSCSVGRFTTKNYLAGQYLFSGGLIMIANSVPVFASSLADKELNYLLSKGEPFYEAIKISGIGNAANILGDPTLKMRYGTKKVNYQQGDPIIKTNYNSLVFNQNNKKIDLKIANLGKSRLYFSVNGKYDKQKNGKFLTSFGYSTNSPIKSSDGQPFYLEAGQEGTIGIDTNQFFPYDSLEKGTYKGKLYLLSNDPINYYKIIPFEITT